MERKLSNDVALGAFILAALAVLAYMSIAVGGLKIGKAVVVSAKFDNAAGLVKDSAVLIAGVNVGSVESLEVAHDKALVKLRLKTDAQVRKDVKAAIRMKSLLGEKYVELLPQSTTAALIETGDVIADTTVPVEIDEVMKRVGPVLRDVDPRDVSAIVHALAQTVGGRGDKLGATLDRSAEAVERLDRLLGHNEEAIDRLLANLDRATTHAPALLARLDRMGEDLEPTTHELAAHGPSLTRHLNRFMTQMEPTGEALAQHGPALVAKADRSLEALGPTLDRLPRTLDALDPSLSRLPKTLDRLDRLVGTLETTLAKIDPILDQTRDVSIFERDGSIKVRARLF